MDYKLENQNTRTLSQFNTSSHFLKKITQLLVSISVFSLLLSHFSNHSYLHSMSIYFPSNISFHLFSQNMDKNTMFLLWNGLLVLMKFSCLINKSSTSKNDHMELEEPLGNTTQFGNVHIEDKEEKEIKELGILQEKEEDKEGEGGMESGFLIVGKEMEEGNDEVEVEEEDEIEDKFVVVEGREQGEEGNKVVSIEELNKIFDEFIRKIKEGIRIEAGR